MSPSYGFGRSPPDTNYHTDHSESRPSGHRADPNNIWTTSPHEGSFGYSGELNYLHSDYNRSNQPGLTISNQTQPPVTVSNLQGHPNIQSFGQRLSSVGRGRSLAISTPGGPPNPMKDTTVSHNPTPSFTSFSPTRLTSPVSTKLNLDNGESNIWSDPVTRRNSDEYVNGFQFQPHYGSNDYYPSGHFSSHPGTGTFPNPTDVKSPQKELFDPFPRKVSAPVPQYRSVGASQPFDPVNHRGEFNFTPQFLEEDSHPPRQQPGLPYSPPNEYLDFGAVQDPYPSFINRDTRDQLSVASSALDLAQLSLNSSNYPKDSHSFSSHTKPTGASRPRSATQYFEHHSNDKLIPPVTFDRLKVYLKDGDPHRLHPSLHAPTKNNLNNPNNRSSNSNHNNNNHLIQVPPAAGLCRFFLQGFCTKANRCKFRHVSKDEYQRVMSQFKEKEPVNPVTRPRNFQGQRQSVPPQGKLKYVSFTESHPTSHHGHRFSQQTSPVPKPVTPGHSEYSSIEETKPLKPESVSKPLTEYQGHDDRVDPPVGAQLDLRFLSSDFASSLGDIVSLCSDQNGCRFLQKKLEERIPYQNQIIFQEVSKIFVTLMTDPFGNYLCQKLMEFCNPSQLEYLAHLSSPFLLQVALNSHGTRTLQKMLDFSYSSATGGLPTAVMILTRSLQNHVIELIKDLSGNHVIQKCLMVLPPDLNQFIFDSISTHVMDVATHRHGCCVIQRCMENASELQKRQLALSIIDASAILVQDPFGNYVIQAVLDLAIPEFVSLLFKNFENRICTLSVQKYSSNVIEKCIRLASAPTRRHLIQELLTLDRFDLLIRDSYANYVVQTCLEVAEPDQRVQLVDAIEPYLTNVKDTSYGKRIIDCIGRVDGKSSASSEVPYPPASGPSHPFTNSFPGGSSPSHPDDHPNPIFA